MRYKIPQTTPRASKRPEDSPPFALRAFARVCALLAWSSLFLAANARADTSTARPPAAQKLACSFRHPICVHALPNAKNVDAIAVMRSFEHAWDVAVDALDLPPPDPDDSTGAYDVYLTSAPGPRSTTFVARRDPVARFDRASAFTIFNASLRGEALDYAAARSVLRAILFRTSPGTDSQTAESEVTALADLEVPLAHTHDTSFESRPDRAVSDAWSDSPTMAAPFADGASFFYSWLDATYGNDPGSFVRACWALTPSLTPPDSMSFQNDPNTFDVLRCRSRPPDRRTCSCAGEALRRARTSASKRRGKSMRRCSGKRSSSTRTGTRSRGCRSPRNTERRTHR